MISRAIKPRRGLSVAAGLVSVLALWSFAPMAAGQISTVAGQDTVEAVQGYGCYRYGDEETVTKARNSAIARAQEEAIRKHRVLVESSSRVKNFQLEEDIVTTTSAEILRDVVIQKEERKDQEICVSLTANIVPRSVEEIIRQRIQAKEISQEAQKTQVSGKSPFGLKVWTNKDTNRFLEDERLVIYVQSDRDAYLRLDYFQADGTVVHIVPNMYRGESYIRAGTIYSFGDDSGPDQYIVQGPYGDEAIKAIASAQPFEVSLQANEKVSESRPYLQQLNAKLRGIKIVPATAAVSLKTESKRVEEYKQASRQAE